MSFRYSQQALTKTLILLLNVFIVLLCCESSCDAKSRRCTTTTCGWIHRTSKQYQAQQYHRSSRKFDGPTRILVSNGSSIFSHDKSNTNLDDNIGDGNSISNVSDMNQAAQSNGANSRSFISSMWSVLRSNMVAAIISVVVVSGTILLQPERSHPNTVTKSNEVKTTMVNKESVTGAQLSFMMTNPFQQFETVGMIPKSYFDNHIPIYGYTERIIDGDTIRVRHIPGYAMLLPMNDFETSTTKVKGRRGGIADSTLLIRLYGVDTPEISKNKNQVTQPFGNEAKDYMKNMIDHQVVKVTLLRKDRYGRAVAMVETVPPNLLVSSKDLSIELARQGYAELYTGGGFEYNVRIFFPFLEWLREIVSWQKATRLTH